MLRRVEHDPVLNPWERFIRWVLPLKVLSLACDWSPIHLCWVKVFLWKEGSRYGSLRIDPDCFEGSKGPYDYCGTFDWDRPGITARKRWRKPKIYRQALKRHKEFPDA